MKHSGTDMDKLFADNKFVISFMEVIQHKFPEIQLKGKHSLRGVISGKFQSININNRFVKKASDLSNVYLKYGYSLLVKEKNDDYKEMSIGEFLDNANKFKPRIITRYKGLGEANSKQLWDTTLNPDTRILIQLTMDDVEKDLAIFEKLHGQSKKNLADRKKMMSSYKIKREDLDN
jgi:DNA gyrase/topoisomerase IV subunit B